MVCRAGNGDDVCVRCSGRTVVGAQISSMESAGTRPLFFPLLSFRNISPSSNFPTQIWGEQRAVSCSANRSLSLSNKAWELSFTPLYGYLEKVIFALNLLKKWQDGKCGLLALWLTPRSQDVHTAHPLRAGTDSNPPPLGSGLIPQIDETVSSGTRAAIIIRLNWLVDQKKITPAILRNQNLVCITGVSKELYDMFMPAILSRPYALSLGCLADPGQPSTHALLVGPSAQNSMGRIQFCRHSYPKSHGKQHNPETFKRICA